MAPRRSSSRHYRFPESTSPSHHQYQTYHNKHAKEFTMGAAAVYWEIRARDAAKAQKFYAELFGWNVDANNPMNHGIVDTGLKMGINGGIGGGERNAWR